MDADAGMSATSHFVRTTVTIREDLYQRLKRSDKGISETLNDILAERFERPRSMFGRFPGLRSDDLREHKDRV
jgi:predicted CopG family antitoxin